MKIGILTYHDAINYGAFFQVYSLFKWIESNYPNDEVKVINYKSEKHHEIEENYFLKPNYTFRKNLLKCFQENIVEYKRISSNKEKVSLFKNVHKKLNLTEFTHDISVSNKEEFDIVVVGSDEVWNPINPAVGWAPAFFGFGLDAKLVSYAPSFGAFNHTEKLRPEIIEGLNKFDKISVRDYNSEEIIKKNINTEPQLTCDPVFLTDYEPEVKGELGLGDFLLIYGADGYNLHEVEQIKVFAREKGLKIISIGFEHLWCDENHICVEPFEFLNYIKKAKFVVTKMFHGTMFSIVFEKQFVTLAAEIKNNKYTTTLKTLGLENRLLNEPSSLVDVLNNEIDYSQLKPKLVDYVDKSKEFLRDALSSINTKN